MRTWIRIIGGLLLMTGLMAVIVGVRARTLFRYGSDLPYSDPWAREGEMMIAPYYEGTLTWTEFFVPHSEHRIAPTLALNLLLVVTTGQWDNRVECLASAALAGLVGIGLVAFALRAYSGRAALLVALFVVVPNALPLAWENQLYGFQSQFYFLIGFSLVAMNGLLTSGGPRTATWWVGLLAAAAASVSMGSGFFCLAAVAVVVIVRSVELPRFTFGDAATVLMAGAGVAAGWYFRGQAPWHEPLHAANAGAFLRYAARCLAWPAPQWPWCALLVWLPYVALALHALRRRDLWAKPHLAFVLAAGLWVLAQIAAMAWGRAATATPAPRYGDVFSVGVIIGCFSLLELFAHRSVRLQAAILGVWSVGILGLAVVSSVPLWSEVLPGIAAENLRYEENVAAYVRTGDLAAIEHGDVPFPLRDWFRRIIDRPALRATLPASVRAPLALKSARGDFRAPGTSPGTPPLQGLPAWGSYGRTGTITWRSAPIPSSRFTYWRIEMAGQPTAPEIAVQLFDRTGEPVTARIAPTREPGNTWRSAYVRRPGSTDGIVLGAADSSPTGWVAVSAPVEVSAASEFARQLCRFAVPVLIGGLVLMLLALPLLFAHASPRVAE